MGPAALSRPPRTPRWVLALSLPVGLAFIYAGFLKIADPAAFASGIKKFEILPLFLVNGMAILFPWWEVAAGAGLFWKGTRPSAAWLVILLSGSFALSVGSAILRGFQFDCPCFGTGTFKIGPGLLLLDLALLSSGLAILLGGSPKPTIH